MLTFVFKREFNLDLLFHGFWDPSLEPGRRVERRLERRPERRSEPRGDPELEVCFMLHFIKNELPFCVQFWIRIVKYQLKY